VEPSAETSLITYSPAGSRVLSTLNAKGIFARIPEYASADAIRHPNAMAETTIKKLMNCLLLKILIILPPFPFLRRQLDQTPANY
jgi:hypothetical protein